MSRILERAASLLSSAGRAILGWLAVPANACAAALGLAFALSLGAWALGEGNFRAALFFPAEGGAALRGELRDLPRQRGAEARASLIAQELLLGPRNLSLSPAFPPGSRLASILYRRGRLYVDLSPDAALGGATSVRSGLAAMDRSLRGALPGLKSLTVTIGGREPFAEYPAAENRAKSKKK